MAPETLVLDTDESVDEVLRDIRVLDPDTVLRTEDALVLELDHLAYAVLTVGVIHVVHTRRLRRVRHAEKRQINLRVDVILDVDGKDRDDDYPGYEANEHYRQKYVQKIREEFPDNLPREPSGPGDFL